jgi:hypothetical protein
MTEGTRCLLICSLTRSRVLSRQVRIEDPVVTKTLEKAFAEASKLSAKEQDELGAWLLSEFESERKWEELFRRSPEALARLGEELDPEKL